MIVIGIHIDGVGDEDGTGSSEGTMWCTSAGQDIADGTENYDWLPMLRSTIPSSDHFAAPAENRLEFPEFTLEFHAQDDVMERFFLEPFEADWELGSSIGSSDTDIDLGQTGVTGAVYVGAETIIIGTDDGDGTYSNCTRGAYGSTAEFHNENTNVYSRVPYWEERPAEIYIYDLDSETLTKYVENLQLASSENESSIRNNESNPAVVQARLVHRMSGLSDLEVNFNPTDFPNAATYIGIPQIGSGTNPERLGTLGDPGITGNKIRKIFAGSSIISVQWGERVYPSKNEQVLNFPLLRSAEREGAYEDFPFGEDPYQVFIIDKRADGQTGSPPLDNEFDASDYISDTASLSNVSSTVTLGGESVETAPAETYIYHPYALIAALLLSTRDETFIDADRFDIFRAETFGADLSSMFSDLAILEFHRLIKETQELKIQQLLLGAGREAVQVIDTAFNLAHASGLYFGTERGGGLFPRRFKLQDVQDREDALDNPITPHPEILGYSSGRAFVKPLVKGIVGELPWEDPQPIRVESDSDDGRRLSRAIGSGQTYRIPWIPRDSSEAADRLLQSLALIQAAPAPLIKIRTRSWVESDADIAIGAPISATVDFSKDYLPDTQTGERTSDAQTVTGVCVGIHDRITEGLVDVTILNLGDQTTARWRGPSAEVDSVDAGAKKIYVVAPSGASQFGFDDTDNQQFTVGDEIFVFNRDLTAHDGNPTTPDEVASVGSDGTGEFIELDAWNFSTNPSAGQIVRLSTLDTDSSGDGYENVGLNGQFASIDLIYVFLSDRSSTLGDAEDDAHRYG